MPRSAKAASTTTKKRTTKRSASRQPMCYEIPESPSRDEDQHQPSIESTSEVGTTSPTHSQRGRSISTTATTLQEDDHTTPPTIKPTRKRTTSVGTSSSEPKQHAIPGLEALEAVNSLYQKLKDSQVEIDNLRADTERLTLQEKRSHATIATLQAELKTEKEKVKKVQQAHERQAEAAHKDSEKKLNDVIASLRSFAPAALKVMPLLDVLTGAADIEYDDATERLYRVLKDKKKESEVSSTTETKQEVSD